MLAADVGIQLKIGGQVVEVGADEQTIGREQTCNVVVADSEISREHVSVRLLPDGRAELRDLGSSNGTFVNGVRIQGSVALAGGEQVRIGQTDIEVVSAGPAAGGATVVAGAPSPKPPPAEAAPATPQPPTVEQTPAAPQPPAPPQPPVPPQPPQPLRPGGPAPTPQYVGGQPPQGQGGGSGKLIGAIVAAVLVLVLAGGAVYWFVIRETDEEQITTVSEELFTEPEEACASISEEFLEDLFEDEEGCRESAEEEDPADSVDVSDVEIDGDEATSKVEVDGGDSDSTAGEVEFIKEDGEWKADGFNSDAG